MLLSTTQEIVEELRAGRMVILVDEEDRENEGDLILAADFVTPEAINFMIRHARGLVCLTLSEEICDRLALSSLRISLSPRIVRRHSVSHERIPEAQRVCKLQPCELYGAASNKLSQRRGSR